MKGLITNSAEYAFGILHWLGNRQINGMNAFDEYAYGIRHDSPPTVLGHLAFVKKTQEKPKTI